MLKSVIYGTGKYYQANKSRLPQDINIIAFADSDESRSTARSGILFEGKEILAPAELSQIEYDLLFICTDSYFGNRIFQQLKQYDIDLKKVRFLYRIGTTQEEWHYELQDDKSLLSTIGGVKILEKYLTDSDIMAEVFIMNNYNVHLQEKSSVFIDVGMNIGIVSLYFARSSWVSRVYGFEPFPDTYCQAVENFRRNDAAICNKIHPQNVALSDKDETHEVPLEHEETGWRTILGSATAQNQCVRIISRKASDAIEEIIHENPGKQMILKIDTEGSEFPIFESLNQSDVLSDIDVILLEYHRNPKPIEHILSAFHFRYFKIGRESFGMIYALR